MTAKKRPEELSYLARLPENGNPLADCVRHFGTKSELARYLGLGKIDPHTGQSDGGRQVLSEWFRRGAIPKKYIIPLNKATGIALEVLMSNFEPYRPGRRVAEDKIEAVPAVEYPVADPLPAKTVEGGDTSALSKKKPATTKKAAALKAAKAGKKPS